jgi:hypothetical protein
VVGSGESQHDVYLGQRPVAVLSADSLYPFSGVLAISALKSLLFTNIRTFGLD